MVSSFNHSLLMYYLLTLSQDLTKELAKVSSWPRAGQFFLPGGQSCRCGGKIGGLDDNEGQRIHSTPNEGQHCQKARKHLAASVHLNVKRADSQKLRTDYFCCNLFLGRVCVLVESFCAHASRLCSPHDSWARPSPQWVAHNSWTKNICMNCFWCKRYSCARL